MFDSALIFKTIADHGSMVKAAEKLSLSPSVVSKKLLFLETELGLQLLRRTTRHIELTEAGRVFYDRITNISQRWDDSIEEITDLNRNPQGTIQISCPQPLCSRMVVPILKKFQTLYPDIRFELLHATLDQLPHPSADITISRKLEALNSANFVSVPLCVYENALFASPSYVEAHAQLEVLDDLHKHQCLTYGVGKLKCEWFFNDGHVIEFAPYLASDNTEIIVSSAVNGLGIAYIPEVILQKELAEKVLIPVLPMLKSRLFETHLYYQKMTYMPQKMRLLIDYLKAEFLDVTLKDKLRTRL